MSRRLLLFVISVQKELTAERQAVRDFVRDDALLRNAVAHRDYASNGSVQVMLFADRLEVWNPGELPPTRTLARLRGPHPCVPYNPLIAEQMFLAHYTEEGGRWT